MTSYIYEPLEVSTTKACHHCGFQHEPPFDSCRIPEAAYYVVSVDPFFSTEETTNICVVDAADKSEAQRIEKYVRSRADQKQIRIYTRDQMLKNLSWQPPSNAEFVFSYLGAWKEHLPPVIPDGADILEFRWNNSVTLTLENTGEQWYAGGGGYDRKGTVLAKYLEAKHMPELRKIAKRAWSRDIKAPETPRGYIDLDDITATEGYHTLQSLKWREKRLYGLSAYYKGTLAKRRLDRISLDGACGFESMETIIKVLGYDFIRFDSTNDNVVTETWAFYKTPEVPANA